MFLFYTIDFSPNNASSTTYFMPLMDKPETNCF